MSEPGRGLISELDWQRPRIRWSTRTLHVLLLVGLVVVGLGPLLWLAKSAAMPTNDTIAHPLSFFPHGAAWSNFSQAWNDVHVGRYFWNSIVIAFGAWAVQIVVATTGGFALSVLRPRYAPIIKGLLLATLFIPVVVLLVPLYVEVVRLPIVHKSLLDSDWGLWLPWAASAFNVILVTRFFDNLPREIFEAARIDGAGPFQLFWRIVLPMSKPILGVVSVFAVLASWRDFLWPFLVLGGNPDKQPLSVRLPAIQLQTSVGVFLAAMFIACLVPIAAFLIFQRSFLRGTGLSGAIKG
jgi:multiple sugar transport system permease protein